jgi:exopolysaccharide biosynthesis polyprenyl glycosylphosphotransferase
MLKQRARLVNSVILALDLALVGGAFVAAYWIRQSVLPAFMPAFEPGLRPLQTYLPLLPLGLFAWGAALLASGAYRSHRTETLGAEAARLVRTGAAAVVALAVVLFTLRVDERLFDGHRVSRSWIALSAVVALALLAAEKIALRLIARYVRTHGLNFRTLLIAGGGPSARAIADAVERHHGWGYRIMGVAGDDTPADGRYPVLGGLSDVEAIARTHAVDEVIFAVDLRELGDIEGRLAALETQGTRARVALNVFPLAAARPQLSELDGIPLLTFETAPSSPWLLACKRALDIALATSLLVSAAPLLAAAAAGIRLTSPGPILFRQLRCGLNGRRFTLYKFRTMVADAETRRAELLHLNEMDGPVFKVTNDPRVTPWGRLLRKFSFDELPQLWNVLKGDMSLVGPRPPIPEEVSRYEPWQRRRLSMKPGLTCLWQIRGRNRVDFARWMELDLEYIDSWSLLLDLKILARTIPAVMTGRGAS